MPLIPGFISRTQALKWNADQPRDKDGKFSSGGGAAAPATEAPKAANPAGPKPKGEYDERANKEVRDLLTSQGFTPSGENVNDPTKPMIYSLKTSVGDPNAGNATFTGDSVHTVLVHPNGEWEHTSESNHTGSGVADLGRVHFSHAPKVIG